MEAEKIRRVPGSKAVVVRFLEPTIVPPDFDITTQKPSYYFGHSLRDRFTHHEQISVTRTLNEPNYNEPSSTLKKQKQQTLKQTPDRVVRTGA